MFAVIETGGKQYKVQYGDVIYVEKLNAAENDTVEFPVVAVFGEEGTKIGAPYVEGATVTGKVVKNGKAKKITVFTYQEEFQAQDGPSSALHQGADRGREGVTWSASTF